MYKCIGYSCPIDRKAYVLLIYFLVIGSLILRYTCHAPELNIYKKLKIYIRVRYIPSVTCRNKWVIIALTSLFRNTSQVDWVPRYDLRCGNRSKTQNKQIHYIPIQLYKDTWEKFMTAFLQYLCKNLFYFCKKMAACSGTSMNDLCESVIRGFSWIEKIN